MLKRVLLLFAVPFLSAVSIVTIVMADGSTQGWTSLTSPKLVKVADLSDNVLPGGTSNIDCTPATVKSYGSTSMQQDCLLSTAVGEASDNGIMFNGSSERIPVVPPYPYYGLQPVPNQELMLSYSSAPVSGSYLHFYTTIRDKLPSNPQNVNGSWQFTLTKGPEWTLLGNDGKPLPINRYAMAFSPNGAWMVADLPMQGFVRINLATFDITPFAMSMQQNGDYSNYSAQVSITDSGQYVVIKPSPYAQLSVYDLNSCTSHTLPIVQASQECSSRDYWSYLTQNIPNLRAVYQPRLLADSRLSFTAMYNYVSGSNFKVAKFQMLAPGTMQSGTSYLGLGDSFAAGEGAFAYEAGTDTSNDACHLSAKSYPLLLSTDIFAGGHSVACSGAKTVDIIDFSSNYRGQVRDDIPRGHRKDVAKIISNYTPGYLAQMEFVSKYDPDVVTLSVGGNDIGFADIIENCVSPAEINTSCYPTYEDRLELAQSISATFNKLASTYSTVAHGGRRVYVIGYPQIVKPGGDCAVNVHLDNHETQLAADIVDYLNVTIQRAASKAGVRYVDVSHAFDGHRLCEAAPWETAVNGFTAGNSSGLGPFKFIGSESYHPNELGHSLFETAILKQTANLTQAMPTADPSVTAPATSISIADASLPRSGRQTSTVIHSDKVVPGLLLHNENVNVWLDDALAILKLNSQYHVFFHSDPVDAGTLTTDGSGTLQGQITVPASLPVGFHTLHIQGVNVLGQPIDITKTVFVGDTATDLDGDRVPDQAGQCVFMPTIGIDSDDDGIDDACDGAIAQPPTYGGSMTSTARLTANAISTGDPSLVETTQPVYKLAAAHHEQASLAFVRRLLVIEFATACGFGGLYCMLATKNHKR